MNKSIRTKMIQYSTVEGVRLTVTREYGQVKARQLCKEHGLTLIPDSYKEVKLS